MIFSIQAVSRFRHAFRLLLSGTPCDCNLLSASGAHQRTLHRKKRSFGIVLEARAGGQSGANILHREKTVRQLALELSSARRNLGRKARQPGKSSCTRCSRSGKQSEELSNSLGFLSLNQSEPGEVVTHAHAGEETVSRLGMAQVITGPGEPRRHISVRMAFSDDRAKSMLDAEAPQLAKDAPWLNHGRGWKGHRGDENMGAVIAATLSTRDAYQSWRSLPLAGRTVYDLKGRGSAF